MATEDKVVQLNNFTGPGRTSVPARTGYLEGASQTYLAGAPLKASSGKLVTLVEDDIANIVGFAIQKATGVTNTLTGVIPALGQIEFEATLENGSTGDYALTQADLFSAYGLAVTATGLWYLDKAETTHKAAVIVELVDPVGTVQGRVRAQLLNAVTLTGITTS